MNIVGLRNICTPALVYLAISFFSVFFLLLQYSYGNTLIDIGLTPYTVAIIFTIKILYVLFWTWLLNLICRSGYGTVSWVLVLLPFVLFFLLCMSFIIFP